MVTLDKNVYRNLLLGTSFYGTGGGGSPELAQKIYIKLANARTQLVAADDLPANGICITAYTVGGLSQKRFPKSLILKARKILEGRLRTNLVGVIPVEIGPLSVAIALQLANELSLPLVDADFVGGRSTPEIFLETITLFNIRRTPLVVATPKGDILTIEHTSSYRKEEELLRSVAASSGGYAYVIGYPITPPRVKKTLTQNTVSTAIVAGGYIQKKEIRKLLSSLNGAILYNGTVTDIQTASSQGFTTKMVTLRNKTNTAKVFVKNECLICWVDDKPLLTCPDLIVLLDGKGFPVFNNTITTGMAVSVIGMKSAFLWRSKKGVQLFNPQLFGFSFNPVLLP